MSRLDRQAMNLGLSIDDGLLFTGSRARARIGARIAALAALNPRTENEASLSGSHFGTQKARIIYDSGGYFTSAQAMFGSWKIIVFCTLPVGSAINSRAID